MNKQDPDVFWGEIAPCEHLVQIYEETDVLLDTLEGFAGGGLRNDESVIIIATQQHINSLDARLIAQGLDVKLARANDRYLTRDAQETLSLFMVDGWPNEMLFSKAVIELLGRGRAGGRKVRAYGEMVALLWADGHHAATVRLEHLWHQLCLDQNFSLFCAYPKAGFTQNVEASIADICAAHSRVVP